MVTKKLAESDDTENEMRKTVVKKSAIVKKSALDAEPHVRPEVTEEEASRMEAELFGDMKDDDSPRVEAAPIAKKGIIRKKEHADVPAASGADLHKKSKLATITKTKIIRKGAVAPLEAPVVEEESPVLTPSPVEVHDVPVPTMHTDHEQFRNRALSSASTPTGHSHAHHTPSAEELLEKMKEREKKKEKEKEKKKDEHRPELKHFAAPEKSITVIRDENTPDGILSYKEFAPEEPQYEEVEEVVEEVAKLNQENLKLKDVVQKTE